MRTEYRKIEGNLQLTEDLALYGMVTGDVTVLSGMSLDLYGAIGGNADIAAGAGANIYGVVAGDVVNSGTVEIRGIVCGDVRSKTGKVHFSADCVIVGARDV